MKSGPPVRAQLSGHLTEETLETELLRVTKQLASSVGPRPVILDCTSMTGYDLGARVAFVDWNRENKGRVRALAVITEKLLWHLVISAMSLASKQRMKGFSTPADALAWLGGD